MTAKKKPPFQRSEQFTELEKLKNEMNCRGWLLSKSMNDLLFKWFVINKQTNNSSEYSKKIFEEIVHIVQTSGTDRTI